MSQNSCCVPGCAVVRKDGVRLHRFPDPETSEEKFKTWILNIGDEIAKLDHLAIYDNRRVCHRHFEDIHKYPSGRLSKLAIPTIFSPDPQAESLGEAMVMTESDTSQRSQLKKCGFNTSVELIEATSTFALASTSNIETASSKPALASPNTEAIISEPPLASTSNGTQSNNLISGYIIQPGQIQCRERRINKVGDTDICDDGDYADDDSDTLVESNVCRVCLAMDVKMYDLKDIELREMFQNITGITVTENNHSMLERLCWECAGRLKAAAVFRNKALLSDALLQGLASTGEQIRKNDITLIKENEGYLKSAGTLSVVKVFHSVDIDPENDSVPRLSENNDTEIVQNTVRKDSIEQKKESIIEEDDDQTDVEDESMIEAPIETEMEYDQFDHISPPNTGEESSNAFIETNPLVSNYVTLGNDKINSADSSPLPGCSHVEPKYPIFGYIKKTPSDCESKIKKHVIITTKRNSILKLVSKNSKELIRAKSKNINVKIGGVSKKTSNKKLVKKTTPTDKEILSLEDFEF